MSQIPKPYNRVNPFGAASSNNPSNPIQGTKLDAEFNAVEVSLDQTQARLAEIQRDDGKLANESVGPDQLSPAGMTYIKAETQAITDQAQGFRNEAQGFANASAASAVESAAFADDSAASAVESAAFAVDSSAFADASAASAASSAASDARFAGTLATAPTTRLNGSPLQQGDEYQNSVDHIRYNWTGAAWVALNSSAQALEVALADPINGAKEVGYGGATVDSALVDIAQQLFHLPGDVSALVTAEADRAEAAADAAQLSGGVYADTTLGLAATAVGRYFSVPSAENSEYLILYQNVAGVATERKRYPSVKAITDLGIEEQSMAVSGLAFGLVDENGIRGWPEVGPDGGPTTYAAKRIGAVLTIENTPTLAESIGDKAVEDSLDAVGIEPLSELNTQAFTMVDDNGVRAWLEVAEDGGPTVYAIERIVEKLPGELGEAPSTYQSGVKGPRGIVSGLNITCWGDSMTAGAGGGGTTYPGVLQSLLTAAGYAGTVANRGVGGENTVTICARAGGNPFIVLPVGGVIPATTTAFEITLQSNNGYVPAPLMQGASSYTGRLGSVAGTFSRTFIGGVYTYYFTRAVAGAEIVANRPTPLYLDIGDQGRGDINLIWIGQNGPNPTRAIQDAKAIIQRLTALDKRFLVISMPGGTNAQDADDALWFAEFGRRFIPIRKYMVQYGLADAGITPTSQDTTDMANGTVPTSLRYDAVHWLAPGYTILANVIFQRLKELEWV